MTLATSRTATLLSVAAIAAACGGGRSGPTPTPAGPNPPAATISYVPSLAGGNYIDFSWPAVPGAEKYWVEIGRSPGAVDVRNESTLNTKARLNGLPAGATLYARVKTEAGGRKSIGGETTITNVLNAQDVIDSLLFGSGKLSVTGNRGCVSTDAFIGWPSGSNVTYAWTTGAGVNITDSVRQTAAAVADWTVGRNNGVVAGEIADPGTRGQPGIALVRASTPEELKTICGSDAVPQPAGCAAVSNTRSVITQSVLSVNPTTSSSVVAHELGHGLSLCHTQSSVAGWQPGPTMGPGPANSGVTIDPAAQEVLRTAWGLAQIGWRRADFVAAGLVPATPSTLAGTDAGPSLAPREIPDLNKLSISDLDRLAKEAFGPGARVTAGNEPGAWTLTKPICEEHKGSSGSERER